MGREEREPEERKERRQMKKGSQALTRQGQSGEILTGERAKRSDLIAIQLHILKMLQ